MLSTFLLGLFLLMSGQELDSGDKVAEVTAMEGSTVILNCSFPVKGSTSISLELLDWLFNNTTVVHRHEKGADDHKHQHEHFRGRTELFMRELPSGNFSLLLKDVKLDDTGLYTCQAYMSTEHSTNNCQLQVVKRSEAERTESPQTIMVSQTMDSMARGHMYLIVPGLLFLLVVILILTCFRQKVQEKCTKLYQKWTGH
ncbi:VTCN1 inhibitor, partial [Polypterus senegalus]|nr:CD276 antigen homolog [Polypterus senegalus]XP_039591868.1 CD276 antigen homolog [Polypterus senegalus]MBN3292571.1 VTCN1 inhibitor [Polypterus senegalus]